MSTCCILLILSFQSSMKVLHKEKNSYFSETTAMNQQDDYFQDEKAFRSILLNDTDPFLGVCDLSGHEFSLDHCDLEEFDSEQSTSDESTEYDFHLDQGLAPFKFERNLDDGNLEFLIEGCMENWNCATQAIESFTGSDVPKVEEDPLGHLTDASSEPEQTAFDSILEELDGEIFLSQLDTRREWDTQAPVRKEAREGSLHANVSLLSFIIEKTYNYFRNTGFVRKPYLVFRRKKCLETHP